jgi:release factor glutamine methyltransferase
VRSLVEVIQLSTGYLRDRGGPTPRLDAELLIGHALGLSRVELYTQHDRPLTEPELARIRALLERRGRREPVAYILGEWGFRGLMLGVDARVLVPRPETEQLVDVCLELLAGVEAPVVLDVGTGSGAIALALAAEVPGARVVGCDVSPDALEVAAANAGRLQLEVELVRSDLFDALTGRRFDLVVANPPYIAAGDIESLEPEVAAFEPRLATTAGAVGTEVAERLVSVAAAHLEPGGRLALECGMGQPGRFAERLSADGWVDVAVRADMAGVERFVTGSRP